MRLLGAFAVAATALIFAPSASDHSVDASCATPTVKYKPARIARGGVVTITGQNFGDDCLDTETPPPGVGPLGSPLTGLVIVINQGANEFVVATGSADTDYSFEVDIVVPAELEPGEAMLSVIGAGDARLTVDPPLAISGATPIDSAEATVAAFGPPTPIETVPPGTLPPVVLPADIPDGPAATTPPLSTAPIDVDTDTDHADLQRAIGVGIAGIVAIGATAFAVWSRSKRSG